MESTCTAWGKRLLALGISLALALSAASAPAQAKPSSAEKRAEAQAIMEQIDTHQTEVNDAKQEYARASAAYEAARAAADEAQAKVESEEKHLAQLRDTLGSYAVGMYKIDGGDGYLDALMATGSLGDFMDSWKAISAITSRNIRSIDEVQEARAAYEEAQRVLEEQTKLAEQEKEAAREAQAEVANAHDALMSEAARISAEVAALQAQEEVLAEEARKAEEARVRAEAKAAQAAQEKEEREKAAAEQAQAQEEEARKKAAAQAAQAATEAAERKAGELGVDTSQPVSYALLQNPCPDAVHSSGFGYRSFDNAFHKGLDMAAPSGTPYYAAESGTVVYATNDGGYNGGAGNWVVIAHGNGWVTKYMHSSRTYVSAGQTVVRGQHIGDVGETGEAFGAHLHFQVELDGAAVNPADLI